ncbi:MAG: DUF4416 family protein [Candidatus Omnitrophica bacterium]|nr:DUF4416 family protein [Candidatus Omnitrophota bacterium]
MKTHQAKLITGIIASSEKAFLGAEKLLKLKFGPIDYKSKKADFDVTNYYEKEMGAGLMRCFYSFAKLIDPAKLPAIKLKTNSFEKRVARYLKATRRAVNIDPGYITEAKLVLASTKNYYHRILLGRGIFAEITLSFRDGLFRPMEWTYPDYRTDGYIKIFNEVRDIFMRQRLK